MSQTVSSCLVVIDVQQGMFTFRRPLYQGEETLGRIAGLLERARDARVPIFHVQHDGGPGHILAKGSEGWLHHPAVQPRLGEVVIEKQHSSPFHDTDFHTRLSQAGIGRLIVVGIQTEMCVDSTCRAAVALGYKVTLVSDAHTTFDSTVLQGEKIIAHHNRTLADGFVDLICASDVFWDETGLAAESFWNCVFPTWSPVERRVDEVFEALVIDEGIQSPARCRMTDQK